MSLFERGQSDPGLERMRGAEEALEQVNEEIERERQAELAKRKLVAKIYLAVLFIALIPITAAVAALSYRLFLWISSL